MKKEIKTIKQGNGGRMEPNLDGKEILTFNEAAAFLRMGPKAIYHGIKNGVIPGLKIGNAFRFNKRALLEALDSKRVAEKRTK